MWGQGQPTIVFFSHMCGHTWSTTSRWTKIALETQGKWADFNRGISLIVNHDVLIVDIPSVINVFRKSGVIYEKVFIWQKLIHNLSMCPASGLMYLATQFMFLCYNAGKETWATVT